MYLSTAIAQKTRQGRGAPRLKTKAIAAPVKGWNAKDPYHDMDPLFATVLDNWFPDSGFCKVRNGNTEHASGVGSGAVETLFSYAAGSTKKMLAAGGGSIYDVTSSGAGSSLQSGFSSNRWQTVNFYSKGIWVNGSDAPQSFDGSTISAAGFTGSGLTPSDLIHVHSFKERLFFIEKNTANFWYGGTQAVTGSLSKFDLGAVHPFGGSLVSMGSFTIDGGDGPDDYIAFFFENGDVLIYAGTDPGDSSAWAIKGRFKMGPPIGRRSLLQVGSDLIAVSADGYMPLAQFLKTGRAQKQLAISDNISRAVNSAVKDYADHFGWQLTLYPRGNMLIANVPRVENAQAEQHVMNTLTGAWARFKGLNAICWTVHDETPYFGGTGGKVYQFDDGLNDDSSEIEADGQTAFVYFGGKDRQKHFKLYRPFLTTDNTLTVSQGLGVDFVESIPTFQSSSGAVTGAEWDVGEWDSAEWAGGVSDKKDWQGANEIGYAAAIRIRTSTDAHNVRWYANAAAWEDGGII